VFVAEVSQMPLQFPADDNCNSAMGHRSVGQLFLDCGTVCLRHLRSALGRRSDLCRSWNSKRQQHQVIRNSYAFHGIIHKGIEIMI